MSAEVLSFHSARKSFAGNMYKEVDYVLGDLTFFEK